jgi:hypothetical protein
MSEDLIAVAVMAIALLLLALVGFVVLRDRYRDVFTDSSPPYTYTYAVDWPKEPWRERPDADRTVTLPTWWLRSIASPSELAAAAKHHDRLDLLRPSIDEIGIHTPLTVNIDQVGRVCLADGHHRLVTADALGLDVCPAQLDVVARIGGYGVPVGRAITALTLGRDEPASPSLVAVPR